MRLGRRREAHTPPFPAEKEEDLLTDAASEFKVHDHVWAQKRCGGDVQDLEGLWGPKGRAWGQLFAWKP